ncbi:hypothetical protein ABI59_14145 [Acidobacteria bacterium Mor1]|nr:hypothetical protein ABI59_14145 [Acidobacteria bacterium Mor1]
MLSLLLFCLFLVPAAMATSALSPLSVDELRDRSDLVVEGTVQSMESVRENDRIFTYIHVDVSDRLKGAAGDAITLKLYGGVHEGIRTRVLGAPCMGSGEEVLLFLKANGVGTFDVVNLAEGKFEIVRDGGEPGVRRDLSGIHYLAPGDLTAFPQTLEELRQAVRSSTRR